MNKKAQAVEINASAGPLSTRLSGIASGVAALASGISGAAEAHLRAGRRLDPTGSLERAAVGFDFHGALLGDGSRPALKASIR